jgi:DNA adenine methylase
MKPFVKWVGGKRNITSLILPKIPKSFNNYFEPFVGGGALFFELTKLGLLKGKKVYLYDKNNELVNAYKVIQKTPNELIKLLKEYKIKNSLEFFYAQRALDREKNFFKIGPIKRAARFIYINKTCFNGLYRVNSKGYFNTPMGKYKNPNIVDSENIKNVSQALQEVIIECKDFEAIKQSTHKNDFVYFDPPYDPISKTASFTAYNKDGFDKNEQIRLKNLFFDLKSKGVFAIQSNSNTPFIQEIYKKAFCYPIECKRAINCDGNKRGKVKELLICTKTIKSKEAIC